MPERPALQTLTLLIALMLAVPAWGIMFAQPQPVPVDRLVKNITAYLEANPEDAEGHYRLGRVHYIAFAYKSPVVGVHPQHRSDTDTQPADRLPNLAERHAENRAIRAHEREHPEAEAPTEAELHAHVTAARTHLRRALGIDPENALYHLTYASLLEQAAPMAEDVVNQQDDDAPEAQNTAQQWREDAMAHYLEAYERSIDQDLEHDLRPVQGLTGFLSYEAGRGYLRLAEQTGAAEEQTVERVREQVAKLQRKPAGGITPVVFSLDRSSQRLSDQLADEARVRFNLDGTGRAQRWPWVRPDTGILVWDPNDTGRITSGRQLFGSVTWWILWTNGYHALAALDDDGDGELTGTELDGIAAWFDRNQNGVSDPGEVTPVSDLDIDAIACEATGREGGHPMNARGIRLEDGTTRPTWDWIAEPVE